MRQADWAEEVARKLLEVPLPRRWAHSQGVARQARSLALILGDDADLLEAAAWLHDVGYAPELVDTGLHSLDGARHLRDIEHADGVLCSLVAYHSCAINEANERGLFAELTGEFKPADPFLSDALTYCDMTTTPDGDPIDVKDRLAEIQSRYGAGHLVTRSIRRSSPHIVVAVRAVQRAQAEAPIS
ncbi:HD domain-containing protein [Actinoallomurus sp. CA-150999]|uniref:HD domain-containing protein n=1 Tax=Actinoallomurus sp. CA-150999 TaxID=3239887 RepID=UPI003D8B39FC